MKTGIPLAPSQQRAWFLDHLEGETAARNVTTATTLRGRLDVGRLFTALSTTIQRCPSLRSSFRETAAAGLECEVAESLLPSWSVVDLRAVAPRQRQQRLAAQAKASAMVPFELDRGPLLRAALLVVADDEAVLILTTHCGILSSASAHALRDALLGTYCGSAGPMPGDYAEVAQTYADWLAGPDALARVVALGEVVKERGPALELPSYQSRPANRLWKSDSVAFELSPSLWARVVQLAQIRNTQPRAVLLGAWAAVLGRYTGGQIVTIGVETPFRTPFDGARYLHPIDHQVLVSPSAAGTIEQLVAEVAASLDGAVRLEGVDFAKLIEGLDVERSLERAAMFQAGFELVEEKPLPSGAGIVASRCELESGVGRHEVELRATPRASSCSVRIKYLVELYAQETMSALAEHFVALLTGALAAPATPVRELEILSTTERDRYVREWNSEMLAFRKDICIHHVVEEQARRTPDNIAVICDGRTLTYAQLIAGARALARKLRAAGVGPEVVVGLHAEHSVELMVGIYGILMAGGAYVPLDPEYPQDRRDFMIEDARVRVLVVQGAPPASLAKLGLPIVPLSIDAAPSTDERAAGPQPDGGTLAYMIYTSGSTGMPKGVQIAHSSVVDLANSFVRRPGLLPTDVVASVAPFTFDMSILTLFCPLTAGATVLLATRDEGRDGTALAALLDRHGATIMKATPSTWRLVVEAGWKGSDKVTSMTGGELLTTDLARRLRALCGHSWNHYGPTEATAICMMYPIVELPERKSIPMGRPMPNTQVYVLDTSLRPVPIGVPGELYVAGEGLARGYAQRPALTAERFIPNPFAAVAGARMYRTGDRVRYLPSGDVEFIGRFDNQIKLRGHRIELEEIEATIATSPEVRAAAVVVREDTPGDPRLVAYVVPARSPTPALVEELRAHIKLSLPAYMVPSTFVTMLQLPTTGRGKLDRRALPRPSQADLALAAASRGARVPPRNTTQARLAKIWEDLLHVEEVGVSDDFFELGGHSLIGMRVVAKIEESFGRRLPLSAVFRHPTIERLATLLTDASETSVAPYQLVTFNASGKQMPFAFVHPLSGQITGIAHLARGLGPDHPLHTIEAWAEWGRDPLSSIPEAAERYVELILKAIPEGPFVLSAQSAGNWIGFEMAHRLKARGREPALLVIFDVGMPQQFLNFWAHSPMREGRYLALAVANVIAQVGGAIAYQDVWGKYEEWAAMTPDAYWKKALEMVRESAVLPKEYSDEQIFRFLRALMWNAISFFGQGYTLRPYDGRVAIVRSDQAERPRAVFRNGAWVTEEDPFRGWSKMVTQPIQGPYYVDGDDHDHWNVLYREKSAFKTASVYLQVLKDAGLFRQHR